MGQRPCFGQGLVVHCLAFTVKMGINFCILLIVGFHCVSGNPLEEKRWGQAASNSAASNKNNIMIGREEEEKRWGQAASNSHAANANNIQIGKKKRRKRKDGDKQLPTAMLLTPTISKLAKKAEEEKRWGQAVSNSHAANANNIQIGKKA